MRNAHCRKLNMAKLTENMKKKGEVHNGGPRVFREI